MSLCQKIAVGSLLIMVAYLFVSSESVKLPICHFLMRDWSGTYVEVMRKCPPGTSYCAARVSNSTGVRSLVIDFYEYYCENEKNITREMKVQHAPSHGCYRFGAEPDEFVCFCDEDFCNQHDKMEQMFLNMHNSYKQKPVPIKINPRPELTTSQPESITLNANFQPILKGDSQHLTTLSFSEELLKLRSPLSTDHHEWKRGRRTRRQAKKSFEQKVVSQQFILAEPGSGIFRKKDPNSG